MAFCCNECKLLFHRKYPNCPVCGGIIIEEHESEDSLMAKGYSRHRLYKTDSTSAASATTTSVFSSPSTLKREYTVPEVTINAQSELERLRNDFVNRRSDSSDSGNGTGSTDAPANTRGTVSFGGPSTAANADNRNRAGIAENNGSPTSVNDNQRRQNGNTDGSGGTRSGGFFDNPSSARYRINTETDNPTNRTGTGGSGNSAGARPNPTRLSEESDRRTDRNPSHTFSFDNQQPRRPGYSAHRPHRQIHIPWRVILTIILIFFIVIALVAIWNARFTILNGILNIFLSLLPVALIIGVVVYLIRGIFR